MSRDLIDRQTVIDAIMSQPPEPHYPSWYVEQIKALPSAQLEIIHCRECRHSHLTYDGKNKYCIHWPNKAFSPTEYIDGDFYCGFAKRREE